jgi:hypothetical protein
MEMQLAEQQAAAAASQLKDIQEVGAQIESVLAAHCLPQVHHVNEPQITKYKLMELQF